MAGFLMWRKNDMHRELSLTPRSGTAAETEKTYPEKGTALLGDAWTFWC